MHDLLKKLATSRAALAASDDYLDHVRQQIETKLVEIDQIASAPLPTADVMRRFEAWLDQAAAEALDRLSLHHLTEPQGRHGFVLPVVITPGETVPNTQPATEILLGLLALVGRDRLREVVSEKVVRHLAGRTPMTATTREKKVMQAEEELLKLCLIEEAMIRGMERAGLNVSRRRDAPPQALLAADASLPS